jgi:WD40 repeat protein
MSPADGPRLAVAVAAGAAMLAALAAQAGARSPAGIVFMCGPNTRDLCVIRPDGTERRRLTRGDAVGRDHFGAVSRAGSLVAFVHSDHTIRIRTLGGRRVARVVPKWRELGTVELDRTGRRLLYTYFDPFDRQSVCRLRVGARRPSCFRSSRAFHAWGPARTIVSTDEGARTDICVERPGNRCGRVIARTGRGHTFFGAPAFSPDGRRLVVAEEVQDDSRLVTFDVRTGRRLRTFSSDDEDYGNPTWSPDGRWIAFDRNAHILAPRPNTQVIFASLWRVPADGGRARRVTGRGYQPAWSG